MQGQRDRDRERDGEVERGERKKKDAYNSRINMHMHRLCLHERVEYTYLSLFSHCLASSEQEVNARPTTPTERPLLEWEWNSRHVWEWEYSNVWRENKQVCVN